MYLCAPYPVPLLCSRGPVATAWSYYNYMYWKKKSGKYKNTNFKNIVNFLICIFDSIHPLHTLSASVVGQGRSGWTDGTADRQDPHLPRD